MIPLDLALNIGGLVMSAAVLVVGLKYALNGMRKDVAEIKDDLKALVQSDGTQTAKISAHEIGLHTLGKSVDEVRDRVNRLEDGQMGGAT